MKVLDLRAWLCAAGLATGMWFYAYFPVAWLAILFLAFILFLWSQGVRLELGWAGLLSVLICSVLGGWFLQLVGSETWLSYPGVHPSNRLEDFPKKLLLAQSHSLAIALTGSLLACAFGLLAGAALGLTTGVLRRMADPLLQTMMAIPVLLYFLVCLVIFPPGSGTMVLVFAGTLWLEPARMIQARLRSLEAAPFLHVAKMMGASPAQVFWRELIPNIMPVLWVSFLVVFLNAILLESILAYLGLGLSPGTPSLGRLIEEGGKAWPQYPPLLLGPLGLMIAWILAIRGLLRKVDRRSRPLRLA